MMKNALEIFALVLAAILLCALLFLLDHEINTAKDLLHPSSLISFLIYGTPLLIVMLMQSLALKNGRPRLFVVIALAAGAALGGLLLLFASQAVAPLDQIRNFLILAGGATVLIGGSVLLIHYVFKGWNRVGAL